ncbi:MAG TPA: hypothetical protein GX709_01870 [Clostridiales bacterium]|nr:hypothetical protein [Clostridiales bacterium]
MKILFICSSNICRSAFCDFVFNKMVREDIILRSKVERVDSAAVFNRSRKLFPKTYRYLTSIGYNEEELKAFKPRYYRDHLDIFDEADIIIGMTKSHYTLLPRKYKPKFITLSEVTIGEYKAIPDPWLRLTQKRFNKDMQEIEKYLEIYKEKLKKM